MTGLLAILILVNAIIVCCNENPHRKRRKAAEKAALEAEMNLTPLHADNTLLKKMGSERGSVASEYKDRKDGWASDEYDRDRDADARDGVGPQYPLLKTTSEGANPYNGFGGDESRQGLVGNAARPGVTGYRKPS